MMLFLKNWSISLLRSICISLRINPGVLGQRLLPSVQINEYSLNDVDGERIFLIDNNQFIRASRRLPINLSPTNLNNSSNRSGITFLSEYQNETTEHRRIWRIESAQIFLETDANNFHNYSISNAAGKNISAVGLSNLSSVAHDYFLNPEKDKVKPPKYDIGDACFCLEIWSGNYFHWLIYVLPKIHYMKTYFGKQMPLVVLVDLHEIPEVVSMSLKLLGINPADCIQLVNKKTSVKNLYLASVSRFNSSALSALRNELHGAVNPSKRNYSKYIYVSRKNAERRKCINENEVEDCLIGLGFAVVMAEDLTFLEQVEIFSNVKVVCGLHGAGLSNMLFMHEKSTVIEIGNKYDPVPLFYSLANALDLNYWYVEGESNDDIDFGRADVKVNIESLSEIAQSAKSDLIST